MLYFNINWYLRLFNINIVYTVFWILRILVFFFNMIHVPYNTSLIKFFQAQANLAYIMALSARQEVGWLRSLVKSVKQNLFNYRAKLKVVEALPYPQVF